MGTMRAAIAGLLVALACVAGAQTDEEIQARVNQVLGGLEGAQQVEASVERGIVSLEGSVLEAGRAEAIAGAVSRIDGVVAVNNDIVLDLAVTSRIEPMRRRLAEIVDTALALVPLLGVALVIVAVFWLLSRLVARGDLLLRHVARSRPLRELIARTAGTVVFLVGLVLALDILGATAIVGGVLGAAGLMGIAIGFAFKDLIENYIASIMLSVRQPFRPDDHVVIDNYEGIVVRLTSRSTLLLTMDGNSLRLPNAQVFKSVILNYSNTPERRFDFTVGIGFGEDLEAVQALGIQTLLEVPGVLDAPGPVSRVEELGDSSVLVRFLAWVDQKDHAFGKVRSDALARIKRVYGEREINMPEPTYQLKVMERPAPQPEPRAPRAREPEPEVIERAEEQQSEFLRRKAEESREEGGRSLLNDEDAKSE